MVDKIKNSQSFQKPESSAKTNSLKTNFKNLSSGNNVANAVKDAPVVVNFAKTRESENVKKLLTNLNDAVNFSKQALESLEEVTQSELASEVEEDPSRSVQSFANDLNKLRDDIGTVLQELRDRAGTAEVIRENLAAADNRLEDVDKAREQADNTGSKIAFSQLQALEAHDSSRLTTDRVNQLLDDNL